MMRAVGQLRGELEREPTDHEVAERLGKSEQRVHDLQGASQFTESTDILLHDEGDFTLYDVTEDENAQLPEDHLDASIRADLLESWLVQLPDKEREVVSMRFGLDGSQEVWTLEAIGRLMGVTRERIRQVQVGALQSLRRMMQRQQDKSGEM